MSWTDNGPVSLPPQGVVYVAAALVGLAALGGIGVGFRAGWRDAGRPTSGMSDQTQPDTAVMAKPIVDVAAVSQQPPVPAANSTDQRDEAAATNAIAVKTAQAQAIQSKQATSTATIDEILTPPTEKPQAPAKPTTDEGAPGAPKSDVPF